MVLFLLRMQLKIKQIICFLPSVLMSTSASPTHAAPEHAVSTRLEVTFVNVPQAGLEIRTVPMDAWQSNCHLEVRYIDGSRAVYLIGHNYSTYLSK